MYKSTGAWTEFFALTGSLAVRLILAAGIMFSPWNASAQVSAPQPGQELSLSLSQAVDLALKNNLRTLVARERVVQSRGEKGVVRSALLPNLSGAAYQMSLTENLAALGIPVGKIPGFGAFIGPFNRFDARFQLVQSIFNLASIRRYQAGSRGVALASDEERLAAQQVITAAALAYLRALEAGQAVATAQANVQLAQRLLDLARNQKEAGIATGIDVARAQTRLANQHVRLSEARTALDTARISLLRVVGAPLAQPLTLSDSMRFQPEPPPPVEDAVRQALTDRVELHVADEQLRIVESQRKAAVAGLYPSVGFFGDYGSSALTPNDTNLPTRSVGLRLDLPLFDGGRTRSEIQAASSRERQAELQLRDLRAEVEKDVRLALENLSTREEQVRAAQETVELAERELQLAQDRFASGVGDNIELVNAQTALEDARQVLVSSLAQFNLARLNLAAARGRAESFHL